jgi:hypothetical protein
LLTKRGWVAVELLAVGDELASRAEADPNAEIEWQAVEECFRRTGRVLHLHFTDGELVRTTPEHPFWVKGEGWVPAGALKAGDALSTLSGEWVRLSEVYDTEQWEPTYNVRVANTHTYFVGDEGWGFALWAHNFYLKPVEGNGGFVLEIRKDANTPQRSYVSSNWQASVQVKSAAVTFTGADAEKNAKATVAPINKLSKALTEALTEYYGASSEKIARGLFTRYGQGYTGNFGALEGDGDNEDETEITTGRDGLFYALYRAPSHGSDSSHRSPLKRDDAKKVFYAVNRLARLSGDERWVPPKLQTDARIEALKPTNQVAGYTIPEAKNPDAANVLNDAHRLAAQYERVLAYQVHKGGGKFGASQIVIWWGDTIGSNGSADAISVDPISGVVTLWDSKAYGSGGGEIESKTFTTSGRQATAVAHARDMIEAFAWKPEHLVPGGLKDKARASLADLTRSYKMITVRYQAVGENFEPLHLKETPAPPPVPNSGP